jgi:hypothetical protein
MGEGNTGSLEVQKSEVEYEALTYQGKFAFYDEEEAIDPMVVDTGLKHSADNMVNTFTANAVAEMTEDHQTGKRLRFYFDGYQVAYVFWCDDDWARDFAKATGLRLSDRLE